MDGDGNLDFIQKGFDHGRRIDLRLNEGRKARRGNAPNPKTNSDRIVLIRAAQ